MSGIGLVAGALFVLASSGADAAQERQARTVQHRPDTASSVIQSPGQETGETGPATQESSGILSDLFDRVMRACTTVNHVQRTVRLLCPDGSNLEYTQSCVVYGEGGLWPECSYREECAPVEVPVCPPAETSPEG